MINRVRIRDKFTLNRTPKWPSIVTITDIEVMRSTDTGYVETLVRYVYDGQRCHQDGEGFMQFLDMVDARKVEKE